jgi:PAS domain S-box-containing protein
MHRPQVQASPLTIAIDPHIATAPDRPNETAHLSTLDAPEVDAQLNLRLLSLLRSALVVALASNFLAGSGDIVTESEPHIWVGILRICLVAALGGLWTTTYRDWAAHWATPLALISLGLACVQVVGPNVMHGDPETPIVLTIAITAAVSTAAPWGVLGQLGAIAVATSTTLGILTLSAGTGTHLDLYPTRAAGAAFFMSLCAAAICRRNHVRTIEAEIALRRSARTVQLRETQIRDQNADLERRVQERTAELEAINRRLEQEIAEHQQATEALQLSRNQLRDILDNTTAVIYLKDREGRYLLINTQYENLFHVDRAELVGRTDLDIFPASVAEALRQNDRLVLEADRPLIFEETVPNDGAMQTYVSVKFPLRDESGAYGVCGISTDITPRKRMEAQLQSSQAQLSALIENTSDAIWSIDRDKRLVVINSIARKWFEIAYARAPDPQAAFDQRAPEPELELWQSLYSRALAGESLTVEREYPMQGEARTFLLAITPIVNDGRIDGATVFAKDITDLKRAEERVRQHRFQLAHALRLHTVGELAAGLAHEINQPLGAITNYAQGCRRRLEAGDSSQQELAPVLAEIAAQALRAGEIIRRLRHMVEKGTPTCEPTELNHVVAEAVHVVETQAAEQGVALDVELAIQLPKVEVDPIQIEQVIVNLLLNGLEAMRGIQDEHHRLQVRTAMGSSGTVEVFVQDTGAGVPEELGESIFEPFFTTKPTGLGLGLSISRSIIEAHGGRLSASRNPDRGTTLRIALPAKPLFREVAADLAS